MRIMLDTNILISGFVFTGPERRLLQVLLSGGHTILVNNHILSELRDVLARKFPDKKSVCDDMLQALLVEEVPDPIHKEVQEAIKYLRDPKDGPILASVLKCRPDIFISGDKDLHTQEVRSLATVLTTAEALRALEGQPFNPQAFTLHEEVPLFTVS